MDIIELIIKHFRKRNPGVEFKMIEYKEYYSIVITNSDKILPPRLFEKTTGLPSLAKIQNLDPEDYKAGKEIDISKYLKK